PRIVSGIYRREIGENAAALAEAAGLVAGFEKNDGRRPRILVAKLGQDGHDRGQHVIASAFADIGFEVDVGPLFQTPEEAARLAVDNGVHVVGVSTLAAGHLALVPALKRALEANGRPDIMVVVGGVIPERDHAALREAGVTAIFPPGTPVAEAAVTLIRALNQRLGYEPSERANFPPGPVCSRPDPGRDPGTK